MKILVADDNATFRVVMTALLQKLGHEVLSVQNGAEAWNILQREYYPILITDWQMPEMDGMKLTRLVRAQPSDNYTYIILLTAHGGDDNYLEGIRAGADDFLVKPPDEKQLAARLLVAERLVGVQNHVTQLEAIMSVCSYCKSVRDGSEWIGMENYVASHLSMKPSHGICPKCFEDRVKPELQRLGVPVDKMP